MTGNSSPQIPFHFGNFQNIDLTSFLSGENQSLINLINLITNKEAVHLLYLWGNTGTGKSHLLQAACKKASETGLHVAYIPMIEHASLKIEMLHDLGELDLVCIDDIQYVSGNIEWQQGLVWLYNELRDSQHSMIISGNKSPTNIEIEIDDLKSRLAWDQVIQIKSPSDDLKIEILKQKANARSFELGDDVIEYLIRRVDRDLGTLISVLDKIDHASLAEKRKITIPFVKGIIS